VIVSAVRTPIGRAKRLVTHDADDLAAVAVRGGRAFPTSIQTDRGCGIDGAFPEGEQGMNLARIVTALAGLPVTAGGTTVNRFCASSLQAFNMGAEHHARHGRCLRHRRRRGDVTRADGRFNPSFNPKLTSAGHRDRGLPGKTTTEFEQSYIPMGMTAENLARAPISRADQTPRAAQPPAPSPRPITAFSPKRSSPAPPERRGRERGRCPRRDTSPEKLAR
jgi:acetyl-CoA acyltransferase